MKKIERQPKFSLIRPPKSEHRPEPPPRSDRPHTDRTLTTRAVPVRFHHGQAGGHDAGGRQALQGASDQEYGDTEVTGGGEAHEQGAQNIEIKAPAHDFHVAHAVADPAHDNDENAREEGSDGDRNVHRIGGHAKVPAHVRSNVEGGLRKEPEGNDPHDDAKQ